MRSLRLTTPMMEGEDVREAQNLLATNPFGVFFNDEFDGEYGEITHQATTRAKFWLGYPETGTSRWHTGGFADKLHGFLSGTTPLPAAYAKRRKKRVADSKKQGKLREKALKRAVKQIGIREDPAGSNNVLYSRWYMNQPFGWKLANEGPPWCAMFVSWCYTQNGSQSFESNQQRWAFCPSSSATRSRAGTTSPSPGTRSPATSSSTSSAATPSSTSGSSRSGPIAAAASSRRSKEIPRRRATTTAARSSDGNAIPRGGRHSSTSVSSDAIPVTRKPPASCRAGCERHRSRWPPARDFPEGLAAHDDWGLGESTCAAHPSIAHSSPSGLLIER